uniref:DnaJ heat shock protein family (Hsp40) member C14 n=1 Tax=Anolis carolinensis TaxID=28377 RepID=H9GM95_ANOCA|nr:PREDICTED: dnaJ homolog subfamily C member 14 [Anolis carolinensis]|eukprot:XP_003223283.1 PREDICTED: dnaJ homolog subfamily C member 14 [Anolis carolinensis]
MEPLRAGSGGLPEDKPGVGRTLLGNGSPSEVEQGPCLDGGGRSSPKDCQDKVHLSHVLEAEVADISAEEETEMVWNGNCDQGGHGGLHFDSPGPESSSCRCQGDVSDLSATYPETNFCDFTCRYWCSGVAGGKDTSRQLQEEEEEEEEDTEDGSAAKAKEELPNGTRGASVGRKVPRQQRHRPTVKGEGRFVLSSGGKHRPMRKRCDGGRHQVRAELLKHLERVASFCVSCFKLFISLIVQVTHRCGEGVEASGKLLYSCCSFSPRDLDGMRSSIRTWIQQAGLSGRKLTRQLGLWVTLAYRLLKMLCAILFLVLMLLLGSLRLCWRVSKSALASLLGRLSHSSYGARLLSAVDLSLIWTHVKDSRTCKWLAGVLLKWHALFWMPQRLRTTQEGDTTYNSSPGGSGPYQPGEEVARLLAMAHIPEEELNPFQVLGLEATASDAELKKAYRHLAVLVHPDKNKHPRAEEAFKVLRAAWDIVSNPERRKEYEIKRMAETELTKSMNEFLSKLQDDLKEAMNTMMCNKCQGKHKRFEMDRDPLNARYCAECSKLHAAEEGDFWAESSMLGLKITYFAMMDGKVYDITEWAGCQRVGISPDTHRVPYHISFGARGSGGRQRAASEGSPASAAELQDFFNRIFQGNQGQMPNGNFFSTPQQPPSSGTVPTPPAPPSKVDSTSQKGDSKQKRRKKVRRPFQR